MSTAAAAAAASSLPRFLLPQLTWRRAAPYTVAKLASPSPPSTPQPHTHNHTSQRPIASQALTFRSPPRRPPTTALAPAHILAISRALLHSRTASPHAASCCPTTTILGLIPHRRLFHSTRPLLRDHHFDTLKFVQRLRDEGFSEEQATALMRVLSDVIEESIQNLTRTMVLREDAERSTYTQKVDFTKLRSELLSTDSTETTLTRASHERLTNDLAKLNSRLRDEISRTQASVRLDLNLEKGRIREEANVQELKIKETETRIEQEVAGLRERVEGVKFSTLQWLM
ncbi:hypothetical protein MMC19_007015 [Ptychographa xylographoides]|nr:hypothetical protein [Ptychographa xylographoides]